MPEKQAPHYGPEDCLDPVLQGFISQRPARALDDVNNGERFLINRHLSIPDAFNKLRGKIHRKESLLQSLSGAKHL